VELVTTWGVDVNSSLARAVRTAVLAAQGFVPPPAVRADELLRMLPGLALRRP